MINLIKNELTKIYKKKSIYITLLVTLIFIIITNVIYKMEPNMYQYDLSSDIAFYERQLKDLDVKNPEESAIYESYKSQLERIKLIRKYGGYDTWQARVIEEQCNELITNMIHYKEVAPDEPKYQEAKQKYDDIIKKINTGDWKHFAKFSLKQIENELQVQKTLKQQSNQLEVENIETQIYQLEVQKQILNWRIEKNICYGNDYYNKCLVNYQNAKTEIRNYEMSNQNELNKKEQYENEKNYYNSLEKAAIAQYDIENGTKVGDRSNAKGVLLNTFSEFEIFIIIISIMIAGTIVSEEFNKGTIKLLLIKPYKRSKILTAKFITSIIMLIIIILTIMIMQFVIGGIIQGFDSFEMPTIVYNHTTNQLEELSSIKYLAMQMVGNLPMYILLMTLAFALSTLFTNSALAITISLLGSMGAPMINALAQQFNLEWIKFFVTPNWDLTQYFFGGLPEFQGLTFGFSLAVIIVYMIIMLVPTYVAFKKKNIKNI